MNVIQSYDRADGKASRDATLTVPFVVDTNDAEWSDAYRRNPVSGMTAVWAAWKVGYLAATGGEPESANPYLRVGESYERPSYPISGGWQSGWLEGQGKRAEDLETVFSEWRSRR